MVAPRQVVVVVQSRAPASVVTGFLPGLHLRRQTRRDRPSTQHHIRGPRCRDGPRSQAHPDDAAAPPDFAVEPPIPEAFPAAPPRAVPPAPAEGIVFELPPEPLPPVLLPPTLAPAAPPRAVPPAPAEGIVFELPPEPLPPACCRRRLPPPRRRWPFFHPHHLDCRTSLRSLLPRRQGCLHQSLLRSSPLRHQPRRSLRRHRWRPRPCRPCRPYQCPRLVHCHTGLGRSRSRSARHRTE